MRFLVLRYKADAVYQINTYDSERISKDEARRAIRYHGAEQVEIFEREEPDGFGDNPIYNQLYWVIPDNVDDFAW